MNTIKTKIVLACCLVSFLAVACVCGYNIYELQKQSEKDLVELRATLMEQFDRSMKLQVETAISIIATIQKQGLPEYEARKRAADLIRELRFDNGNYFWIDTYNGVNVVLLGRTEVEGKSRWDMKDTKGKLMIQEIIAKGKQPGGGFTDYWFPKPGQQEPLPKRGYSLAFEPYGWVVGAGNWYDDTDKAVNQKAEIYQANLHQSMWYQAGISFLAICLAIATAWLLGRSLSRPLVAAAEHMAKLADGDFQHAVEAAVMVRKDEIGSIGRSLEHMRGELARLMKHIAGSAEQVAAASEQLTASTEQSAQATNQVAATVSEVAQGSARQAKAVDNSAVVVEQMSASIQQVAVNANAVSSVADKTANAATQGNTAVNAAMEQMKTIEKTVSSSAQVVTKLGERSKEIGQIVDTISGIAGQTNLLALNAAIEAARAGEQGRGFAVVAEEVRKLAEQSQEAAKQIANLIGEIQAETDRAVVAMDEGSREVKSGTEVVNSAGQAFRDIVSLIGEVSSQIRDISAAIQQMAAGSQQIVASVRDIDIISKDTAAQTQTISAATEEQSATMEEIAASSQALARMAENLQGAVGKFKV